MALKDTIWSDASDGLKKTVKGLALDGPVRAGNVKTHSPNAAPGALTKAQKERGVVQQREQEKQSKTAAKRNVANASPGDKQEPGEMAGAKKSGSNAGNGKTTLDLGKGNADVCGRTSIIGGLAGKHKDARGRNAHPSTRMNAYSLLELDLDEIISPEMRAAVRKTLAMQGMISQHEQYMKRYQAARKKQQAYVNMLIQQRGCTQGPHATSNSQLPDFDGMGNAFPSSGLRSQSPTTPCRPTRSATSFASGASFMDRLGDVRLPALPRLYGQGAPEGIPIDQQHGHCLSRRGAGSESNLDRASSIALGSTRASSPTGHTSFRQTQSLSGDASHSKRALSWLDGIGNDLNPSLPAALVPAGTRHTRCHSDDQFSPWLVLPGEDSEGEAEHFIPTHAKDVQAYLDSVWDANAGKQQDVKQLARIPIPDTLNTWDTQSLSASEVIKAIDEKVFVDGVAAGQDPVIDGLLLPAKIVRHRDASLDEQPPQSAANPGVTQVLNSYCRGRSGRSRSHGRGVSSRRKRSPSPMMVASTVPTAPLSVQVLGCMAAKADGHLGHVAPLQSRTADIPMGDAHVRPEAHMECTITSQVQKSLGRKFQQQLEQQQTRPNSMSLPMGAAAFGGLAHPKPRHSLAHSCSDCPQQHATGASAVSERRSAASVSGSEQALVSPFAQVPKPPPDVLSKQAHMAFGLPTNGGGSCSMFHSARLPCGMASLDRGAAGAVSRHSADEASGKSCRPRMSFDRISKTLPQCTSAQVTWAQDRSSKASIDLQEAVLHMPDRPGPVLVPHPELSNLSLAFARGDRLTKTVYKHHLPQEARGAFANKKSAFDAAVGKCERVGGSPHAKLTSHNNQCSVGHEACGSTNCRRRSCEETAMMRHVSSHSSRLSATTSTCSTSKEGNHSRQISVAASGAAGLTIWHMKQGQPDALDNLHGCPDVRPHTTCRNQSPCNGAAAATACDRIGKAASITATTPSYRLPDLSGAGRA